MVTTIVRVPNRHGYAIFSILGPMGPSVTLGPGKESPPDYPPVVALFTAVGLIQFEICSTPSHLKAKAVQVIPRLNPSGPMFLLPPLVSDTTGRSTTRHRFHLHGAGSRATGWGRTLRGLVFLVSTAWTTLPTPAQEAVVELPAAPADFVLSDPDRATTLFLDASADAAVVRAAGDLASDIERVTDRRPIVARDLDNVTGDIVLVGVLGQSPVIDGLVASGKLAAGELQGTWESFIVQVVEAPLPHLSRALVIAGSDRRGAIYGLYEISTAIGISPWYWWADVTPEKQTRLVLPATARRFGPPSVKYRGIFLNDEDWGLQPWAAKTFEPESGDIGPKTYARLFELMLRLRANTVWPAMHPTTKAFNTFAANKQVAGDYAIVMGSSHAEPMLRNNVGEWTAPKEDYNYVKNRAGVLKYWEQRVRENADYENIFTLGMRGIHDSHMQGPTTDAQRIRVLEQIFTDQRALIAAHVHPEVEQIPQMFCAYKEVLELYRQGLQVPADVTIVWPDDNFGYVRNFASAEERKHPGGFGVYYHLSYLGRPLSYLWLSTIPPALIWEEMHKAYEHGADQIWIANVGDLKPAEITTEFFLQMAWDINRWQPHNLGDFLTEWAAREFSPAVAPAIASLLSEYYLLNYQRKPEHLQWWLPGRPHQTSSLTDVEVDERLTAFAQLETRAITLREQIAAPRQDAFYQLVTYPITGSNQANIRYFEGERGNLELAQSAHDRLKEETKFYNEVLAGGKWRGIMSLEPADKQWASMRIAPWSPPPVPRPPQPSIRPEQVITIKASEFTASAPGSEAAWTLVPGLGRTGGAITVLPTTVAPVELTDAATAAPWVEYTISFRTAGRFALRAHLLPTHPIRGSELRLAVALDDQEPQLVSVKADDGGAPWAQGVLDSVRTAGLPLFVTSAGPHTLRVYGIDPGVVLDKMVVDLRGAAHERTD